jgi:hypothetical protein
MDAQADIISREATFAACVLVRGEQLALVELTGKPDVVQHCTGLIRAGFVYRGLLGNVGGEIVAAPYAPLDCACNFDMGRAARTLSDMLSVPMAMKGDSAEWLTKLHTLKDPRMN